LRFLQRSGGRAAAAGFLSAALLGFAAAAQSPPPVAARQLLVMSDIHFDPMAAPQLVDRLAAAEPADWPPAAARRFSRPPIPRQIRCRGA
jgi:hypothetical protein